MILITGAPKSGLTLLATYFHKLGFVSSHYVENHNTYADPVVASINNDILRAAGCTWNHAPNGTPFNADGALQYRIGHFFTDNPNIDFLTDPQFAFTWPIWQRIARDVDIFVSFREPGEAAHSIRDEFGGFVCEAITIWSQHVTRLASVNAAFVEFGANIEFEDYEENVGRAMSFLELDHQPNILEKCFDQKQIHQTESTSLFPPIIKLYELLKSRKEN